MSELDSFILALRRTVPVDSLYAQHACRAANEIERLERELAEAKVREAQLTACIEDEASRKFRRENEQMRPYSRQLEEICQRVVRHYNAHKGEALSRAIQDLISALSENPAHECGEACLHASDCAVHNAPAYPAGECTCGAENPAQETGEDASGLPGDNLGFPSIEDEEDHARESRNRIGERT